MSNSISHSDDSTCNKIIRGYLVDPEEVLLVALIELLVVHNELLPFQVER